jgi:hypothetical protein
MNFSLKFALNGMKRDFFKILCLSKATFLFEKNTTVMKDRNDE